MDRILDSDRLAQMGRELREQLASSNELADDWIRRAARMMAEQMLSAEVDEALGRGSYQRRDDDSPVGYRNGYKNRSIKTAEGKIALDVPQVRGRDEPYRSAIWQALGKRSPALQKLAVEMYARGLSTRDIEDLLKELSDDPEQTLLSKSAVSRVTEVLWEEFEAFAKRDLGSFDVVYLFCDARGVRIVASAGRLPAGDPRHLGHLLGRIEGSAAPEPGEQGVCRRVAGAPAQRGEPQPAPSADGDDRRGAGPDQGGRGDVARERARPLLVPQDAEHPGQGARRDARDGQASARGRARRARSRDRRQACGGDDRSLSA